MSFEPSQYTEGYAGPRSARKGPPPKRPGLLGKAIARTRGRIARTRKLIRAAKAEIHALAAKKKPTVKELRKLHGLEWTLHRDQHILVVLLGPRLLGGKLKGALSAEEQAGRGVMQPKAQEFPPPPTPPPAEKPEAQVVTEAKIEAVDPKAADVHDAEVAQIPPDAPDGASVSLELAASGDIDVDVPVFQRPLFWLGVGLAGFAFWQRDALAAMLTPKGAEGRS